MHEIASFAGRIGTVAACRSMADLHDELAFYWWISRLFEMADILLPPALPGL